MFPGGYVRHVSLLLVGVLLSVVLTVSWYTSGVIKPAKAEERPPLAWQFVTLNVDRNECLRRAYLSLATEIKEGIIERKENFARLTSYTSSVDIICMKIGKRETIAFIVMTASGPNKFQRVNSLTVQLLRAVESGGPYE